MRVAVFEDSTVLNLTPLTYTKAIFDLLVGCYTLLERVILEFGRVDYVFVRSYLTVFYAEERSLHTNPQETDDSLLLINPRYIVNQLAVGLLKAKAEECNPLVLLHGDNVVGALIPERLAIELLNSCSYSEELEQFLKNSRFKFHALSLESCRGIENLWNLIEWNEELLSNDLLACCGKLEGDVSDKAVILGGKVSIMEGAEIGPYAVIDCRKGPVFIDKGAVVNPFSYIEGPSYIGKDTVVMPGAKLRGGVVIGPTCRVGGEVEKTVFHGYSNKYHDGFIGHAYVGEWVNLGALTTNSDLKNTYGTVRVTTARGREDTCRMKVGAFIGDMAKTSIGTFIYTGKRIGVASHLHGLVAEDVPSFTIYAKQFGCELLELELESAIKTQKRMMARRGIPMSEAMERLIRDVFRITAEERQKAGVKRGPLNLAFSPLLRAPPA